MTDLYVYHFRGPDRPAGDDMLFTRSATLETIEGKGEPVMDSQIVVDHTELDGDGFLVASVGNDSYAVSDLTAQIRSLKLRAETCDFEALGLNEGTDGERKYALRLESRELRDQARRLKQRRAHLVANAPSNSSDKQDFVQFGGNPTTD